MQEKTMIMAKPMAGFWQSFQSNAAALVLMWLVAPVLAGERTGMAETAMNFSQLMILGRRNVDGQVFEQLRQSLPVPVRDQGKLRVAFMFCPALATREGSRLTPPVTVAWLDPRSGELTALKAVSSSDFGQRHPAPELLGEFRLPDGLSLEEFLARQERLFQLYDALFAAWASDPLLHGDGKLHDAAREFMQIFGEVSEPPLTPYYDALGKEYFEWVRALARGI